MSTKNDGGPAFPNLKAHDSGPRDARNGGMSLRDWLAGQALVSGWLPTQVAAEVGVQQLAWHCYDIADAMLAERAK